MIKIFKMIINLVSKKNNSFKKLNKIFKKNLILKNKTKMNKMIND